MPSREACEVQMYDVTTREDKGIRKWSLTPANVVKLAANVNELIEVEVGNVQIKASGLLDANDLVSIDGYEPMWLRRVILELSIEDAPRLILEGVPYRKVD